MAKPITLPNGNHWNTRSAALAYFKGILGRYRTDEVIPAGKDHDDLLSLLQHYDRDLRPGEPTKVGSGVLNFSKGRAGGEGYSTECFYVHRTDGTMEDFSYIQAVNS